MRRLLLILLAGLLVSQAQDAFEQRRKRMVEEQIERRGVANPAVLEAMRSVPRHLFVPDNLQPSAYEDHPLPIGHSATISQPYIVAYMTELLEPERSHKVLEVGTGSGYQAAVLAKLVNHVYTIEIVPELAASSRAVLERLDYRNVTVRQGDGYLGWPEQAPFDRIMLTAAPQRVPEALIEQLKPGGKLVAPVGRSEWGQNLVVVDKAADGKVTTRTVLPVRFVPMVRERK
jgi:protein-L-isoaspartate(D-aspartate) O-methyltransferase